MYQALPKISVITPSYNQGRFLEDCIGSVLNQGYPNVEYIIIDGGSTDESVAIIQKHQEKLAFWVSEPDNGQSDAINKGFRKATGDIVAWLNADDYYFPEALATIAKVYRKNPKASFYFGDGMRVDEFGQPIKGFFPDGKVVFNRKALVFGLNYILQPSTFINRASLSKIIIDTVPDPSLLAAQTPANYLDPKLHYGMDTDLWIRLSRLTEPVPVSTCLAASREYGTTKTSTGSFQRIEELRQIAEKHSGVAMTPGVLCYFLDTLHQVAAERGDVFTQPFIGDIEIFWSAAANLLAHYGASSAGFPNHPFAEQQTRTQRLKMQFGQLRSSLVRVLYGRR